ncbi:MAG: PQQ-binding-like beta-propeller repeat protein [Ktedonobacterales bacterium]
MCVAMRRRKVICPQCQYENVPYATFCMKCGARTSNQTTMTSATAPAHTAPTDTWGAWPMTPQVNQLQSVSPQPGRRNLRYVLYAVFGVALCAILVAAGWGGLYYLQRQQHLTSNQGRQDSSSIGQATTTASASTATASPAHTLYVASKDGLLTGIDAVTGQQLWSTAIGASPTINYVGQGELLLTANQSNSLYPSVGHMYAIDLQTHAVLWITHLNVGYLGEQSGIVYVTDATGTAALNIRNDQRYWHYDTAQAYPAGFALGDGVIYLSFAQDDTHAYLDAIQMGDGARLWRHQLQGTAPDSVLLHTGKVYVSSHGGSAFSQYVEAFDAATGASGWIAREGGTSRVNASKSRPGWSASSHGPTRL